MVAPVSLFSNVVQFKDGTSSDISFVYLYRIMLRKTLDLHVQVVHVYVWT